MIGQYAKFVVSALLAATTTLQTVMSSNGHVTPQGWVSVGISLLTALGVLLVPNQLSTPRPTITVLSEQNEKLAP